MRPDFDDTIAAIATPMGEAGLGVVRLSGPQALDVANGLFASRQTLSGAPSHTLHHGWIVRDGVRLDEAVAAVFRAPTSYTGENVVEFSCHGSPAVLRTLLAWCCDRGARLARPGEFTQRAYTHGRMDLAQAEAVAALISARSSRAAQAAAAQLQGGLSRRVTALRQGLIDLLADVEANLDFAEEANPNVSGDRLLEETRKISAGLAELQASSVRGRVLREGLSVVLAGRPNAGKSSLFNAFLAQDRAMVTDVPGTTRDTLEERLSWDGHPITLIDTAGLRDTTDPLEAMGATRARAALSRADVVVWVIDASAPLHADDAPFARALPPGRVVAALNKCDRGGVVTSADAAKAGVESAVAVSALTGHGLPALRTHILSLIPADAEKGESGAIVTNERHAERLNEAGAACEAAAAAIATGRSEESIALDLRRAAGALGLITGEDVGEAVLDSIFRRFCIGK